MIRINLTDPAKERRLRTRKLNGEAQKRYYALYPERAKASRKKWDQANPERKRETNQRWREDNRDRYNANARARRQKDHRKARNLESRRQYGITLDERDALLRAQGGVCACCGATSPGDRRGWHTEHDHRTGKVRGVTCFRCNNLLGRLGDSAEEVDRNCKMLLAYLARAGDVL